MPTGTNEDLIRLLESIVYGNEDSLTTLYHLTKKTTFSLILRILHNQAEAEEVLIDVYTQVWEQDLALPGQSWYPYGVADNIAQSRPGPAACR